MSNKTKHAELEKLLKSPGWKILQEQMETAILQAAYQMVDQRGMALEEIHFRRGSMWAARRFLDLPTQIKAILENELLMDAALKAEADASAAASKTDDL
jgi:hypothetical protein